MDAQGHPHTNMKHRKLHITQRDFMLANRKAARDLDIALHGKPTSFRSVKHVSKKIYNRKKLGKTVLED